VVPGVIAISFHCGHWSNGRYASTKPTPAELRSAIPDADASRIWWSGNNGVHPNWLIPLKSDPIGGGMRWNDTVVTVERVAAA
jgi:thiosulfate reductase/polysulfide reductase chain A